MVAGNRKSIGIEICYSKSGGAKYREAEAIADGMITEIWLIDFKAGKLSLDDALALKVIIDQRRKKG